MVVSQKIKKKKSLYVHIHIHIHEHDSIQSIKIPIYNQQKDPGTPHGHPDGLHGVREVFQAQRLGEERLQGIRHHLHGDTWWTAGRWDDDQGICI